MRDLTHFYSNASSVTEAAVTAGTADNPTPAAPADPNRRAVEFYNTHASIVVYISSSPIYATGKAVGRPLGPGLSWTDSETGVAWYVFADSGTAGVRVKIAS